jgi:hypothetical protein
MYANHSVVPHGCAAAEKTLLLPVADAVVAAAHQA